MALPSLSKREASEVEELYSSWTLLIVCMLLMLSLLVSYYLQIKRIRAIHETVVSIFMGVFVGLVIRLAPGHLIRDMLAFKSTIFFNLLLPPIILNSGYELRQDNFFRNFGTILVFAFLGTFISAVGLGVLVYLYSFLRLESLNLSLIDCLIFGSTLSATDPVTILAIFQQHRVDPKLYSIIFGESLLNDAVAIVMYETLSQFHGTPLKLSSLPHGIGIFLFSFSFSTLLGIVLALACSLLLKHSHLHLYPSLESSFITLLAYTSYFLGNALPTLSGIVSLLFCSMTLKHYAYHTMSSKTQKTTKYVFSVAGKIAENFVFLYLGVNLFVTQGGVFRPIFILVALVATVATRYAAVFPLSEAINAVMRWARRRERRRLGQQAIQHAHAHRHEELPHSYQMMLFWAGLRGAVGVALASGFTGDNADALRTTVLVVVVLTVVMFGGTTSRMLEVMGIKTGVDGGAMESSDEEEEERNWRRSGRLGVVGARWDDHTNSRFRDVDDHGNGPLRTLRRYSRSGPPPPTAGPLTPGVVFDASPSDSDGEVLPLSATAQRSRWDDATREPELPSSDGLRRTGEAWFQAIDERYLMPLFSNAVASRTFHARRANRNRRVAAVGENSGPLGRIEQEEDGDESDESPILDGTVGEVVAKRHQEFVKSMGSFWRGPQPSGSGEVAASAAPPTTDNTAA